jgi:two-component system chemotaxis response regulator CheY
MDAMIDVDVKPAGKYLAESRDHLDSMQVDLLVLEESGGRVDEERVSRIFRAVHSIQGGAGIFELVKIGELAHQMESVLMFLRSGTPDLTQDRVRGLLRATVHMRELIQNPGTSNRADIAELMGALGSLCVVHRTSPDSFTDRAHRGGMRLRVLLAEDDFASRLVLQTFLSRYGACHIAVNGREAVEAVRAALERGQKYDLICMDIMMPEIDGREAVRQVRALEAELGIHSTYGAKIIMTTAVDDVKEVIRCFQELCDGYLVKPIELTQLLNQMKSYQLIQ